MIPKSFKINRELLVNNVIRLKLCDSPSLKVFEEYLNKIFVSYGFYAVNLPIDNYIPYKPFSMVFNNARLHFFNRNKNQIIYPENIKWREFANWIAKMFQYNKYFYNKLIVDFNQNRNKDYKL